MRISDWSSDVCSSDLPAQAGQHDGLDQELHQHFARDRADGEADADLPRALRYRNQHDVHDADAADQQGNRRHRRHDLRQYGGGAGQRVADLLGVEDVEIVLRARLHLAAFAHQFLQAGLDRAGVVGVVHRDHDLADVAVAGEAALDELDRHDDDIVLIPESALAPRGARADHLAGYALDAYALADRVLALEQGC